MAKSDKPAGHHVGHRHKDPKHKAGEWFPKRKGDEAEDPQQAKDLPKGVEGRRLGHRGQAVLVTGGLTLLAAIAETVQRGIPT